MFRKLSIIILFSITAQLCKAQLTESFVHSGELGVSIGLGHYYGDISPTFTVNKPKFAAGAFYLKQFNNYVGLKIAGNYAFVGYSDMYSKNAVQQRRNLSFNSNIWELTASGQFNFFKFYPGFPEYRYTPYVSLGVGVFSFDPYAYLNNEKVFLRPLGTEGQGSALYPALKAYNNIAMCIPVSFGFKYNINESMNWFAEVSYRFTTTDYLDDVSGVYAPDAYPTTDVNGNPSTWYLLQDRSYETGSSIGIKGRQRGNSTQKDSYLTFQVGISFNLQSYRCPSY
jgi:hypothetical protein